MVAGRKRWDGGFNPDRSITFSATRTSMRRIFSLATTDRFISSIGMDRSSLPENETCSLSSARESRVWSSPGKRNCSSPGTGRSISTRRRSSTTGMSASSRILARSDGGVLLDPNPRPDASRGVPAGQELLRAGRRHRPRRGGHPAESLGPGPKIQQGDRPH